MVSNVNALFVFSFLFFFYFSFPSMFFLFFFFSCWHLSPPQAKKDEVSKLAEQMLAAETLNVDDVVRLIGRRPFAYQGTPGAGTALHYTHHFGSYVFYVYYYHAYNLLYFFLSCFPSFHLVFHRSIGSYVFYVYYYHAYNLLYFFSLAFLHSIWSFIVLCVFR